MGKEVYSIPHSLIHLLALLTDFIYDGSFEGFLTAVFEIYTFKANPARIITSSQYQPDAFSESKVVHDDETKANRVWKGLKRKLSVAMLSKIYACFLSALPDREHVLLSFFKEVFATNESVEENYRSDAVLRLTQISQQVLREKHRFEAFVRFQKLLDNTYYASIDPDYNIIPLIASHFTRRYADQAWIIYDLRRKYGVYYDKKSVQEIQFDFMETNKYGAVSNQLYDEKEELYQVLWKDYFKSVNIPERKNMKLHRQHVPIRYWKYLTEKEG